MTWFGERYRQAFWPLATLPLAVGGAAAVVVVRVSAVAVAALFVLALAAALGEVVIWRALQAAWWGEPSGLWPWSQPLLRGLELTFLFVVVVALGAAKSHRIATITWPTAVLYAALAYGVLAVVCVVAEVVDRRVNGPR